MPFVLKDLIITYTHRQNKNNIKIICVFIRMLACESVCVYFIYVHEREKNEPR